MGQKVKTWFGSYIYICIKMSHIKRYIYIIFLLQPGGWGEHLLFYIHVYTSASYIYVKKTPGKLKAIILRHIHL